MWREILFLGFPTQKLRESTERMHASRNSRVVKYKLAAMPSQVSAVR